MGPVIEAVDAGYVDHAGECAVCRRRWPCPTMLTARKEQLKYADRLRLAHDRAVAKATGT